MYCRNSEQHHPSALGPKQNKSPAGCLSPCAPQCRHVVPKASRHCTAQHENPKPEKGIGMPSAAPGERSPFCAERRTHGRLGVKTPGHDRPRVRSRSTCTYIRVLVLTARSTHGVLTHTHTAHAAGLALALAGRQTLALRPLHNGSSRGLTRTPGTPGPPRQDQVTRGPCRRDRPTIPLRPSPNEGHGGLAGSRLMSMFQRRPG